MISILDDLILFILIAPSSFVVLGFLLFFEYLIFKSILNDYSKLNLKQIFNYIMSYFGKTIDSLVKNKYVGQKIGKSYTWAFSLVTSPKHKRKRKYHI